MQELRIWLDAIRNAVAVVIAMNCSLVMQTRTGEKKSKLCVSVSVVGVRRAAGNGLGRGRPTRERGQ